VKREAGVVALLACVTACSPPSSGPGHDGGADASVADASVPDASVPDAAFDAAGDAALVCEPGGFWPCDYNPACAATKDAPADHLAYTSTECLSCHGADAGTADPFLFAGMVWNPYTKKGAEKIEVGVRAGSLFYYACSDPNGLFFVPASAGPDPDWTKADSRIRTGLGEKMMPLNEPHQPGCNGAAPCHASSDNLLLAPL
jgi:mono/diheme cytochrome c family protein